jgi:uncharacterized protein YodC (DUF2158 family)
MEKRDKIELYDIVQLKSGGPWMTVDSITNGVVFSMWFDSNNFPLTGHFKIELLKKVKLCKTTENDEDDDDEWIGSI